MFKRLFGCNVCFPARKLPLKVVFDEVFSDLHGVECRSLLYLVADEPECDAVGIGKVLPDTAYEDIVAAFVEERHGVGES